MNLWIILIEMLVFAAFFTAIIFAYYRGDRKYSPASIHNYPPDIQEVVSNDTYKNYCLTLVFQGVELILQ